MALGVGAAVADLPDSLSDRDKINALSVITKLLENVIRDPQNQKYRMVYASNAVMRQKLRLDGGPRSFGSVLQAAGFRLRPGEAMYVMSMIVPLHDIQEAVDTLTAITASLAVDENDPNDPTNTASEVSTEPSNDGISKEASRLPASSATISDSSLTASASSSSSPVFSAPPGPESPQPHPTIPTIAKKTRNPRIGLEERRQQEQLNEMQQMRAQQFASWQETGDGRGQEGLERRQESGGGGGGGECGPGGGGRPQGRSRGGFLSTLFGGGSSSSSSSSSNRNRRQQKDVMTLSDLPQTQRKGG